MSSTLNDVAWSPVTSGENRHHVKEGTRDLTIDREHPFNGQRNRKKLVIRKGAHGGTTQEGRGKEPAQTHEPR